MESSAWRGAEITGFQAPDIEWEHFNVIYSTLDPEDKARGFLIKYQDQQFSYCGAVSCAVMEELAINESFSFGAVRDCWLSPSAIRGDVELPEPGVGSELLSILFPVRCVHCGAAGNWLCRACAEALEPMGPCSCPRCGGPGMVEGHCPECRGRDLRFDGAASAFRFEGPSRSLVHRLKYSGQRRLAGFMAAISAPPLAALSAGLTGPVDGITLTYVPLHRSKMASRGYNQAGMYARALGRRLGWPLRDLLSKNHPTTAQNRLDFGQRRNNLSGSFGLSKQAVGSTGLTGGTVILVDDVYTTGSTASECAGILKQGLGVQVYIWTFARTVRGSGSPALIIEEPAAGNRNVKSEGTKNRAGRRR